MNTIIAENAAAVGTPPATTGTAAVASIPVPPSPIPGTTSTTVKVAVAFLTASSDAALVIAIGRVIDSMTGNTAYPTPVPSLATVAAARVVYVSAVNALDRSRAATVRRNQARLAVTQLLRDLALYVQHTCAGDMSKLLGSGFPVQKPRRVPVGVLIAPQNVRLRPSRMSGQLLARCNVLPNAKAYQWRYATTLAPTLWTQLDPVMTASITLQNLTRGTDYVVQVRAFGTRGSSDWSGSATLMAA
jgi:hypothetical protein